MLCSEKYKQNALAQPSVQVGPAMPNLVSRGQYCKIWSHKTTQIFKSLLNSFITQNSRNKFKLSILPRVMCREKLIKYILIWLDMIKFDQFPVVICCGYNHCSCVPALASSCRVIHFSWYLFNCMNSVYNVFIWSWLKTALRCPAPADFLTPLLFLKGQSVCSALQTSVLFLPLPLSLSSKPGCSTELKIFSCPLSCSPPLLFVSADRSFLVMFQAIWALPL